MALCHKRKGNIFVLCIVASVVAVQVRDVLRALQAKIQQRHDYLRMGRNVVDDNVKHLADREENVSVNFARIYHIRLKA